MDDEHLTKLKKAMTNMTLKVHAESLCCGPTGQEIQMGKNADEVESLAQETDIENQYYVPQDNDQNNNSSPRLNGEQCNGGSGKLWAALLSLCVTVCDTLITEDQDFAHQFVAIVPGEDAFSFCEEAQGDGGKEQSPHSRLPENNEAYQ